MFVLGENHFRKCFSGNGDVWLVRKIEFSENWFPLTQKKWLWLQKSFYTFIFTSKYFQRERERESKHAIVDDRAPIQSDDCRRTLSSSPCRSRELQSDDRNPRSWLTLREIAPSIAISQHQSRSSCLRKIAISRRRSRSRLREIATSIAISPSWVRAVDRDQRRGRRTGAREVPCHRTQSSVDRWWFFFWVFSEFCPCFARFVFSFFFSKHQKIFFKKFFEMQSNTWKHFLFRKIAFSKNKIFSKNTFTRTKHSLHFPMHSTSKDL